MGLYRTSLHVFKDELRLTGGCATECDVVHDPAFERDPGPVADAQRRMEQDVFACCFRDTGEDHILVIGGLNVAEQQSASGGTDGGPAVTPRGVAFESAVIEGGRTRRIDQQARTRPGVTAGEGEAAIWA